MSDNIFIQSNTPWYSGIYKENDTNLNLAQLDARYFKISGGTISGLTTFLAGVNINGNVGIGNAAPSYKLDVNGDINTNTTVLVSRTSDGTVFDSECGSSNMVIYHFNNGDAYLGTSTANSLVFQTSNVARMVIDSTGAIGGINSLTGASIIASATLSVNGIDVESNLPPALPVQGGLNPASNPSVIDGYVWYTSSSRYYGQRFIDANNFSLLTFSAGGVYNDGLRYTHSSNPVFEMPLANTSLKLPILNATTRIDSILVNCQNTWATGASRDLLTLGSISDSYARWSWSVFNATSNFNSHMTLYNQNQNSYGINFGAGQVGGASKGAMMVINGPGWDGSFISCGTSAPNGSLHINAGKSQSVPSGYGFTPSGANAVSGGTVNISLFSYWNIWVAGSVYCTSDRRLKNIIKPIDPDNAMNLLNITPQWYKWKRDSSDARPQLGLIAQDLLKANLSDLTCLFENNDVDEEDLEFNLKSKSQLVVSYDKIPLYLLEIIKKLNNRVDELTKTIEIMRSYTPLKKHIDKSLIQA